MKVDHDESDPDRQTAPDGAADLVRSIVFGVIFGLAANVTLLILGYSFWFSLLMHSVVGAVTMGIVLYLATLQSSKQRSRRARRTSIQTVQQ